ncbi:hypothetical protein AB5I41_03960 [Sphingomonas sp. MMS24-JH45]
METRVALRPEVAGQIVGQGAHRRAAPGQPPAACRRVGRGRSPPRRSPARRGGADRRVERSRAFASAFQYGIAAAVVLAIAGFGAATVYDALSAPAQAITQSMDAVAVQ